MKFILDLSGLKDLTGSSKRPDRFVLREPLKTMKFETDEQVKSGVYFGK